VPARYRRPHQGDRSTIHLMCKLGYGSKQIAAATGFHPNGVSRELPFLWDAWSWRAK